MALQCCKKLTFGALRKIAITLALILNYYVFSIALTFYNKFVVSMFKYPLVMTYTHLIVKFLLASVFRNILECCNRQQRPTLGWKDFALRIGPVGLTSILDIGLSNWSFEFITISLYTMTKTSAIVFLLLFALALKVEKFRWLQICVVLCISLGLFLFTYESTQFNLTGFIMCLAASVISGLRWTLTQKVAQKDELGLKNPLDFMYHIQPWMMIGLLPMVVPIEGLKFAGDHKFMNFRETSTILNDMGILLGGALLAFCLEFGEFLLVRKTSSLTLSVSSMFKECMVLLMSHHINHDELSAVNILGFVCCMAGVAIHVYLKASKVTESQLTEDSVALLRTQRLDLDESETEIT